MSKERAKKRAAREHEAAIKAAARGSEKDRREQQQPRRAAPKAAAKPGAAGSKKTPKQSRPRTPADKRHHAPVGRPDGPLARRRRVRTRLVVVVLVLVNVAAWLIWPDWSARLAVLIVSVITAPLLAAFLLRRR